jgi:hypothetical protein
MTCHDASVLLIEIKKAMDQKFKPTPKDMGVMEGIVDRIKQHRPISEKQGWALQEIYRRSQGHGQKLYSRVV